MNEGMRFNPDGASDASRASVTPDKKAAINPLICATGSTYRVSAALVGLAGLLEAEPTMDPDTNRDIGLSFLLEACAAALRHMDEIQIGITLVEVET